MRLDRRTVLAGLASAAGAGALAEVGHARQEDFSHPFRSSDGSEHLEVAMLLYPRMTALDLLGPHHFLGFSGAKIHLVTNQPDLRPVVSDSGLAITPTTTMADCPAELTLLFTPGGSGGTLAAARDSATIEFMHDRGSRARFVSSVCTGSLILGAAGLLHGKRATSHWSVVDCLTHFGAIPVRRRVVEDRNVITAAGVSAGLDSGASLLARLRGRPLAEAAVLMTEYAPQPPFPGGTVDRARPEVVRAVRDQLHGFIEQANSLRSRT